MVPGKALPNAAQRLRLYAHIRGNIILGDALYDSGIIVQKVLVTQFRRIGVNRGYLSSHIYKNLFDAQAAKPFSVFNLLIELLQAVEADQPYHTVFQRLYADHGRLLWQKTGIVAYKIPFLIEIRGLVLAVLSYIVSNQAGFYKDEIAADLSRGEQMPPFFIFFSMKQLLCYCFVGR